MPSKKLRNVIRTAQVVDLLRFLELTPAAAGEILTASVSFGDSEEPGAFADLRTVRWKLATLAEAGLVSIREYAVGGRRPMNFYQLSRDGYRFLHGKEPPPSYRRRFDPASPHSREHTYDLSRLITHLVACAHRSGVTIPWAEPENTYMIAAGPMKTKPDFSAVFSHAGKRFNNFFERDRGTEPIDSSAANSIRNKILAYEAYYDLLLARWKRGDFRTARPRFRVPFWTTTMERAEHILYTASQIARNPSRLLVYATTIDAFLNDADALCQLLFLDHHGNWQALVDSHPTARFTRESVRLSPPALESPPAIW